MKLRRYRSPMHEDAILHDFDPESRTLRIAFVSPDGMMTGVTYQLCPLCGVTMEELATNDGSRWICTICGFTVA